MSTDISDTQLITALNVTKTIAMIGASMKPERASFQVGTYLTNAGYKVIPINPGQKGKILFGQPVVGALCELDDPDEIDMVDIFRKPEFIPQIVDEAIQCCPNLKVIWMQLGLISPDAAQKATDAGLIVVQDRCPKIEHRRLQSNLSA